MSVLLVLCQVILQ